MNPNLSQYKRPKQSGYERDRRILLALEEYRALSAAQIQVMFFNRMEYGQRKAQDVMLRLYRKGKVNRSRGDDCYYYYLSDKPPGMVKHLLATNWVRLWMQKQCAGWEKFHSWSYEQDYKILRCDGFAAVKNNMTGNFRFSFVEMDRVTNNFDKVEKYNRLFEQQEKILANRWWIDLTSVFPVIQIVTLSPTRKDFIQGQIGAKNKNGLVFNVKLLDSIQKEVMKC